MSLHVFLKCCFARVLLRSPYDAASCLPFGPAYGVPVSCYLLGRVDCLTSTGYALLADVEMPLSLLSAHSSTVVRMHRLMLYSLRVGSEATDEGKAMLQPVLQHELREFEVGRKGTDGKPKGTRAWWQSTCKLQPHVSVAQSTEGTVCRLYAAVD